MEFKKDLIEFIKHANSSFTCIKEIKKKLDELGFVELRENNEWNKKINKAYVIRNDASIIAIDIPKNVAKNFSIITTHSDTPSLFLKPNGSYNIMNYLKYNIMPYGGILNYGWLDHPLSLSGRIIYKKNNLLKSKIIDFKKPMLIVPSVAIHQNDKANTNLDLNAQIDLQPIISLSKNNIWDKIIKKYIKDEVIDYDLFAYSCEEPIFIGYKNELLISPRIDNLTSVFSGLTSFLNTKSNNIKVFTSFNNEEIGSLSIEGADSNFLLDTLKRIAANLNLDIASTLSNSFIINSDNTHAIHPNHKELADDTGFLKLGEGIAIIKENGSSTNSLSSAIIKEICNKYNIKYQDASSKNDSTPGSTLSGISIKHVSVLSVDIGIPQLSMHSSIESCCYTDILELYKLMCVFYKTKIIRKKENIYIE